MKFKDRLYFHKTKNSVHCFLDGHQLDRIKIPATSRHFFKFEDNGAEYFIKAEHYDDTKFGQCSAEVYFWENIRENDKRYFVPIVEYKLTGSIHWCIYPYLHLEKIKVLTHAEVELYDKCYAKCQELTDKYNLCDVSEWFNLQWFIHNGETLIVDYAL